DAGARAGAAARTAREELERLHSQRATVEAGRDPAPPPPPLPRSARADGSALWQVVDFADHLGQEERAGLEAALQASGLLDAWVRPGGRLLEAGSRDVVLVAGPAASPSLAEALVVDLPEGSDVPETDVAAVLRGIELGGDGPAGDGPAGDGPGPRVGTDGSWRL